MNPLQKPFQIKWIFPLLNSVEYLKIVLIFSSLSEISEGKTMEPRLEIEVDFKNVLIKNKRVEGIEIGKKAKSEFLGRPDSDVSLILLLLSHMFLSIECLHSSDPHYRFLSDFSGLSNASHLLHHRSCCLLQFTHFKCYTCNRGCDILLP